MLKYLIAIFLVLSSFQFAGAHSLGQSLEKQVNGYFIDVGYSAVDKIYTSDTIRFDFNLWNENRADVAGFDHVWVRIAPKDKEGISFAGFLYRPEFLLTGMSYTFQEAGLYELTVRFLDKDDKNLAEASFPLTVEKESGFSLTIDMILGAVGGIITGLGIGFVVAWFLRKKIN